MNSQCKDKKAYSPNSEKFFKIRNLRSPNNFQRQSELKSKAPADSLLLRNCTSIGSKKNSELLSASMVSPNKLHSYPRFCKVHGKKFKAVCKAPKCQKLICTYCGLYGDHKDHPKIPLEEFQRDLEKSKVIFSDFKQSVDKLHEKYNPDKIFSLISNSVSDWKTQMVQKINQEHQVSLLVIS